MCLNLCNLSKSNVAKVISGTAPVVKGVSPDQRGHFIIIKVSARLTASRCLTEFVFHTMPDYQVCVLNVIDNEDKHAFSIFVTFINLGFISKVCYYPITELCLRTAGYGGESSVLSTWERNESLLRCSDVSERMLRVTRMLDRK